MKEKVVIGMSGGVDSSVAALLLKEAGYDVIGVTMQIWQDEPACQIEENGGCCGISAVEDARKVANTIGIPYYVMNFKNVFKEKVIDYFCDTYLNGATPNPCIACNRYVKWEALLHKSRSIGADYLATGHYAKINKLKNGRYAICNSNAEGKDQTYALYNLTQEQLKHTLFPVGEFNKEKIRKIAEKNGLPVAYKNDSQDICFVPDHDYAGFISKEKNININKGNFVNKKGEILGEHKGIINYTIGQRRGLGISYKESLYVISIDVCKNEVVLGTIDDLLSNECEIKNINYMGLTEFDENKKYFVKIRYNHKGAFAKIIKNSDDKYKLLFDEPQRGFASGQAAVIYENDFVAGGGIII